jgi:hypothetical protein
MRDKNLLKGKRTMLTYTQKREFTNLVNELGDKGFTSSSQVSKYIMKNRLGYKYKNIAGIVTMRQSGRNWDFKGGFPSHIYAMICEKLDLGNSGSRAQVVSFRSFGSL